MLIELKFKKLVLEIWQPPEKTGKPFDRLIIWVFSFKDTNATQPSNNF